MRRMVILAVALILTAATVAEAKVTLPPARDIKLNNGLTIRVIERHSLPLVTMGLCVRAGSSQDPAGKEGLAGLSNELLMRGTPSRTAQQIAEEVAMVGGSLSESCGRLTAGFDCEFLSEYGEVGFAVLGDILTHSLLAQEEFDKIKERQLASIQSTMDDPGSVATVKLYDAVWGGSPFAHTTDGWTKTVEGLTRDDVVEFIKTHYTPDNSILVVCGDVTSKQVKTWSDKYLKAWKGKAVVTPLDQPFPATTGKQVFIYDKPDAPQTQIRIGQTAFSIASPDLWAFEVASSIYGGSFTSRLTNEIRVNRGLSYSVHCSKIAYQLGGVVYVSTFTKSSTVGEVVDIILDEARKMQTEPVSDSEYVGGVKYRCGLYPLEFETNDDIVGTYTSIWMHGLDKSYYEDYQENLRTTTPEQGREAAQKYFPQDNYILVLVGNAAEIKEQVEKFGPVTIIPLADLQ